MVHSAVQSAADRAMTRIIVFLLLLNFREYSAALSSTVSSSYIGSVSAGCHDELKILANSTDARKESKAAEKSSLHRKKFGYLIFLPS